MNTYRENKKNPFSNTFYNPYRSNLQTFSQPKILENKKYKDLESKVPFFSKGQSTLNTSNTTEKTDKKRPSSRSKHLIAMGAKFRYVDPSTLSKSENLGIFPNINNKFNQAIGKKRPQEKLLKGQNQLILERMLQNRKAKSKITTQDNFYRSTYGFKNWRESKYSQNFFDGRSGHIRKSSSRMDKENKISIDASKGIKAYKDNNNFRLKSNESTDSEEERILLRKMNMFSKRFQKLKQNFVAIDKEKKFIKNLLSLRYNNYKFYLGKSFDDANRIELKYNCDDSIDNNNKNNKDEEEEEEEDDIIVEDIKDKNNKEKKETTSTTNNNKDKDKDKDHTNKGTKGNKGNNNENDNKQHPLILKKKMSHKHLLTLFRLRIHRNFSFSKVYQKQEARNQNKFDKKNNQNSSHDEYTRNSKNFFSEKKPNHNRGFYQSQEDKGSNQSQSSYSNINSILNNVFNNNKHVAEQKSKHFFSFLGKDFMNNHFRKTGTAFFSSSNKSRSNYGTGSNQYYEQPQPKTLNSLDIILSMPLEWKKHEETWKNVQSLFKTPSDNELYLIPPNDDEVLSSMYISLHPTVLNFCKYSNLRDLNNKDSYLSFNINDSMKNPTQEIRHWKTAYKLAVHRWHPDKIFPILNEIKYKDENLKGMIKKKISVIINNMNSLYKKIMEILRKISKNKE